MKQRERQFLLGRTFLLKSHHKTLGFFNCMKELHKVTSRILLWAIMVTVFDFDIEYAEINIIPLEDALLSLKFNNEPLK